MSGHCVFNAVGIYRPCAACKAPAVDPFPKSWSVDLIKQGPAQGPVYSYLTPHHPGCLAPTPEPDPGIAVRVPGVYISGFHPRFPEVAS